MGFVEIDKDVSKELKQLYAMLKSFDSGESQADYHYIKYIVQNGERDYMYLLLQQLNDMAKIYNMEDQIPYDYL